MILSEEPMRRALFVVLTTCFAAYAGAEEPKHYEPLSLDPPPGAIEGVNANELAATLKSRGYSEFRNGFYFCSKCGLYLWVGMGTNPTGEVTVESYAGKGDIVGFKQRVSAFMESTPGNPPENMRKSIAILAENAAIGCAREQDRDKFAKLLHEKLTQLVYAEKGLSLDEDVRFIQEAFLFENLRILLSSSHRLNTPVREASVDVSAAECRTWSDNSGKFNIAATYLSHDAVNVMLVNKNGQRIEVPLDKLSADDIKWLSSIQRPLRAGKAIAAGEDRGPLNGEPASQPKSRWLNTSYDTTIFQIGERRWAERDNKTQKVKWQLKELRRDDESVELYLAPRDQTWRLTATKMELKKGDRWEWLSNGKWVDASRK